jgi:DNA-directed RNA polymerase specialized sigma24 family protein
MKVTDFGALVEHWKRENAGLRRETQAEPPPTDETLDEVTARHVRQTVARHKDCPLREIAARLGCSENTVRKWLKFS